MGLRQVDAWFGMLQQAYRDVGVYEDTNLVILSDHGQQDLVRSVKHNVYLAERGFIGLGEQGEVKDYTVCGIFNGMSMTFWLENPEDQAAHDAFYRTLCESAEDGIYGFNQVFTRAEAAEKFHLDGDFAFIVESNGYTSFDDDCTRPWVFQCDLKDYRMGHATHGYIPANGPQPMVLAKGRILSRMFCCLVVRSWMKNRTLQSCWGELIGTQCTAVEELLK